MRLDKFILTLDADKLSVDDVVKSYWDDNVRDRISELTITIEAIKASRKSKYTDEQRRELDESVTERAKLNGQLNSRPKRVGLAFNQLFLADKVKMVYDGKSVSFTELKAGWINSCLQQIEGIKELIQQGHDDIMTKCWLSNLYDYLEKYKQTEIVRGSKMEDWMRCAYKPKGELFVVGSQLCMEVWPRIIQPMARQMKLC